MGQVKNGNKPWATMTDEEVDDAVRRLYDDGSNGEKEYEKDTFERYNRNRKKGRVSRSTQETVTRAARDTFHRFKNPRPGSR